MEIFLIFSIIGTLPEQVVMLASTLVFIDPILPQELIPAPTDIVVSCATHRVVVALPGSAGDDNRILIKAGRLFTNRILILSLKI